MGRPVVLGLLRAAALAALSLVAGCADDDVRTIIRPSATYRDSGPYAVGVTTFSLPGSDERLVEVWYPAPPAATGGARREEYFIRDFLPDAIDAILPQDANPPFLTGAYRDVDGSGDGPFPLVIFAHGAASYRLQSTFLTTHLASWGFVVASVDYLERGLSAALGSRPEQPIDDTDLTRMVVDLIDAESAGGALDRLVDASSVAIVGHSAGGGTARRFARQPDVVAYIPLSAGAPSDGSVELPNIPSMWISGDIDGVVGIEGVRAAHAAAAVPARLVVLENAGHLQPSDICEIGASGGGVVQIALDAGLPVPENLQRLGTDGCQPEAVASPLAWKVINHYVTAQVRSAFGIDSDTARLSGELGDQFEGVTFRYEERL